MNTKEFTVSPGRKVQLKRYSPQYVGDVKNKEEAEHRLHKCIEKMAALQDRLYAENRQALLIIFQAMDAAGKDSAIKSVMSGLNPQGVQVHSFKAPTREELDHDYLWRSNRFLPERGRIGIFNRSYYEEVLIVRVHPEILASQQLTETSSKIWKRRYEDINHYEEYLTRNGIHILKFFLNVSREEQKKRFLERIDTPAKNWKFSMDDVRERGFWDDYVAAYEEMLTKTSTSYAHWHIVPADHKWFTRIAIAQTVVKALRVLNPQYPKLNSTHQQELSEARRMLEEEDGD